MSLLNVVTNVTLVEFHLSESHKNKMYLSGRVFWVNDPEPKVYKNGVLITDGFSIDFNSGNVIFIRPLEDEDVVTADFTHMLQLPSDSTVTDHSITDDNPVPIRLTGSNVQLSSVQETNPGTIVKTYTAAEGAKKITVYCESGRIRIRTDGQPCTATTGAPLGEGWAQDFNVASISIYFVEESTVTVVSE